MLFARKTPPSLLDLDQVDPPLESVFLQIDQIKTPKARSNYAIVFRMILRQVFADDAVALNLFKDPDDGCLRIVEYVRGSPDGANFVYRELAPMPGVYAMDFLEFVRSLARKNAANNEIPIRRNGSDRSSKLIEHNPYELRLMLGPERPVFRSKWD